MMPFYVGAGSPLEQPAGRTQWDVLVHRPLIAIHGTVAISLSLLLDSFHYCVIQLSDEKAHHEGVYSRQSAGNGNTFPLAAHPLETTSQPQKKRGTLPI